MSNENDELLAELRYIQASFVFEPRVVSGIQRAIDVVTGEQRIRDERDELRAESETERIRLAACGVVALSNTPESAAKMREMLPEYRAASCDDVARAVDREMALRAENERLMRFAARVLHASREFMTDVDGADIQEFGIDAGLLEPFKVDEPCGEACECAVGYDFPTTCYRYTQEAHAAVVTLAGEKK